MRKEKAMRSLVELSGLWQYDGVLMKRPSYKLVAIALLVGSVCVTPLRGLDLSLFDPHPESYFDESALVGGVLKNTANVESELVAGLDPKTMQSPLLHIRLSVQLSESNSIFVTVGDLRMECDGRWRIWAGDKMETLYDAPPPSLMGTGIYNLNLTLRADNGHVYSVNGNAYNGNLPSSSFDDLPLHWTGGVSQWTQATVTLRGLNSSLLAFDVKTAFEPTTILVR